MVWKYEQQWKASGITLLELLVVLVILSVVLAVTSPSLRGTFQREQLDTAGRDIVSLLRVARAEAIFREHPVEVRFDLAGGRYRLDLQETGDDNRRRRNEAKLSDVEQIRELPRDVWFSEISTEAEETGKANVAKVVFYQNGSATGATIVLENKRGRKMAIELTHATALSEASYVRSAKETASSGEAKSSGDEE